MNALFSGATTGFDHIETTVNKQDFYSSVKSAEKLKLGNHSKAADTWIGGPTQNLYPQHIPCNKYSYNYHYLAYTGHIPGIVA